jgi:uncharacterized damage-inducible protein DinB
MSTATATTAPVAAALLAELLREAKTTRRVLARIPREKFAWKPHPTSMTLGQLASHVAGIPGGIARRVADEGMDVAKQPQLPPQPEEDLDLVAKLDQGVADCQAMLSGWDERSAFAPWRLTHGEKEVFTLPRVEVIRTMLLNHWYHHRGQLTVYLRMLEVPVPVVYGRSADERSFG